MIYLLMAALSQVEPPESGHPAEIVVKLHEFHARLWANLILGPGAHLLFPGEQK